MHRYEQSRSHLNLYQFPLSIDLFLGGGRREFFPTNETDPDQTTEYGRRKDGRNLIEEWKDKQQRIGKKAEFVWQKDQFDRVREQKILSVALRP